MTTLATVDAPLPNPNPTALLTESQTALSREWRRLTRVATIIAIATSPSIYYLYHHHNGWSFGWSVVATFFTVVAFRGLVDVIVRRLIPWPSLFGQDEVTVRETDVTNRRRAWTWRFIYRWVFWILVLLTIIYLVKVVKAPAGETVSFFG